MKLTTSSLIYNLLPCLALLITAPSKSAVLAVDSVTSTSGTTTVSSVSVTRIPTSFPTVSTLPPASTPIFTVTRELNVGSDTDRLYVLLTGTMVGDNLTSDANELSGYLGPQLSGLCRVSEDRVNNIVLQPSGRTINGMNALTFTLEPGSNPTNDKAMQKIINLFQSNNQVKLILSATGPEFLLSLPIYTKTDDGPCPPKNCMNTSQCRNDFTGDFYCQYPSGCYACDSVQGTTQAVSVKKGNSNLGLIGLLAIPIVIAAVIIVAAVLIRRRQKQKKNKKEFMNAIDDTNRPQVYQNTVGKSYATVFNESIFKDTAEGETSLDKKSTIRF